MTLASFWRACGTQCSTRTHSRINFNVCNAV